MSIIKNNLNDVQCSQSNIPNHCTLNPHFGYLNQIVYDTIHKNGLTQRQFNDAITEAYVNKYCETRPLYHELTNLLQMRAELIRTVSGMKHLGVKRFIFIMEKVLKEQIPDDSEIQRLILIGRGKDLRGQKRGRLLILDVISKAKNGALRWRCKCDCGKETIVASSHIITGHTKSCGCLQCEIASDSNTTHGMTDTFEYNCWSDMIKRCKNSNSSTYHDYGGRGITICDRWRHSFENFYEDMGNRPEGMTIDRRDNDGNYEPGNCRWATKEEQDYNKRSTLRFDDGTPIGLFVKENNLNYNKVVYHYHKNKAPDV